MNSTSNQPMNLLKTAINKDKLQNPLKETQVEGYTDKWVNNETDITSAFSNTIKKHGNFKAYFYPKKNKQLLRPDRPDYIEVLQA